mmetsp:Transcript_75952/g.170289  ORF Transcript_75952/g.170289 Transcript_75952/m.170289 type:complete len:375 (+) Transcript_75952:47-1171(+)
MAEAEEAGEVDREALLSCDAQTQPKRLADQAVRRLAAAAVLLALGGLAFYRAAADARVADGDLVAAAAGAGEGGDGLGRADDGDLVAAVAGAGGAGNGLGGTDDERIPSAQLLSADRDTDKPMELKFYMYRAQSDLDYPLENVNAADLPGVMWYLHNEVVASVPRKFNVTRILRYIVTMKSTQKLFDMSHTQFGPYVAFDRGQCTVQDCDAIWLKYGFNIGCQVLDLNVARYVSPFQTTGRCGSQCGGLWYSLPGPCPANPVREKTEECMARMPGGSCRRVTGESDCTYHVRQAGEVRLDELCDIRHGNYTQWWVKGRNREYDAQMDLGIGCKFWDLKRDEKSCNRRMDHVVRLFKERYPLLPETYGEPPCDFS